MIHSDDTGDWISLIHHYRRLKYSNDDQWAQLKRACAEHVHTQNNWQPVFEAVLGDACLLPAKRPSKLEIVPTDPTPSSPETDNTNKAA